MNITSFYRFNKRGCSLEDIVLVSGHLQQVIRPHTVLGQVVGGERQAALHVVRRVVAVQVAFERQTLKPVFRLIGYRLWV